MPRFFTCNGGRDDPAGRGAAERGAVRAPDVRPIDRRPPPPAALYAFSDIEQVLDYGQDVCFNILSVRNGNAAFLHRCIEITETGTYQIEFCSVTQENIPLALTVNGAVLAGVVYKNPDEHNHGAVIADLRRGDKAAVTNKFFYERLTLPENVIGATRVANASLSLTRLSY